MRPSHLPQAKTPVKTRDQRLDPLADPEGIVTTPDQLQARASTVILVKEMADTLERHYPGWLWAIRPDERGGVVNVFSLRLSGLWGYRLHTKNAQEDPRKWALLAGGEILERFRQRRAPYEHSRWAAAPRHLGMVDMDITDMAAKVQRRHRDDAFTRAVRKGQIQLHVKDERTATGTHRQLFIRPSALWEK